LLKPPLREVLRTSPWRHRKAAKSLTRNGRRAPVKTVGLIPATYLFPNIGCPGGMPNPNKPAFLITSCAISRSLHDASNDMM
jgi:hypothetical protein